MDIDGARSYHINEYDIIRQKMDGYSSVFAQNSHNPYLFYPLMRPYGKNTSGIVTCTNVQVRSAVRKSLPMDRGVSIIKSLDCCYIKEVLRTENGKTLILYNFHFSAKTRQSATAKKQMEQLFKDMTAEYKKGNYVIAGGEFNKDLLMNPVSETWMPASLHIVVPLDSQSRQNSNRPYSKHTFVLTVDGFVISENVKVKISRVKDHSFVYSDHTPVYMDFLLQE